ncbi:effector-associated constant component EACC1 [Streptomyces sp. NPDC055722]
MRRNGRLPARAARSLPPCPRGLTGGSCARAFRGRAALATRVAAGAPEEGTLGTGMDALTVALGNGGAFTVFATVAVTWLKRRTGRMAVKITRLDGSAVEVSSDLVRPQNAEELRETAERLVRALDDLFQGVSDRRRSVSAGRADRCGRCARSRRLARGCAA